MTGYNALADNRNIVRSFDLRLALLMQADMDARRECAMAALRDAQEQVTASKPTLLGCWVNGLLKFQSRDHDAIYGYARDKMSHFENHVWVAPIGSFVDDKAGRKADARKTQRIHSHNLTAGLTVVE